MHINHYKLLAGQPQSQIIPQLPIPLRMLDTHGMVLGGVIIEKEVQHVGFPCISLSVAV